MMIYDDLVVTARLTVMFVEAAIVPEVYLVL